MKMRNESKETPGQMRLNKFLSVAGIASRRKADELIAEGKVQVNGVVVTNLGVKVDPANDKIFYNQMQVALLDEPVYILFNKPKDSITTMRDERGRPTVMDYIKHRRRVFPVGRLDRNTTGVLLLTNDGEFANKLMHPRSEITKGYQVTLDKPLVSADGEKLAGGIRLSDGMTRPARIHTIPGGKGKVVGIVIHEGRNRQVHRMFEALGYVVEKLDRVSYADLSCDGLKRGAWRHLTKGELMKLKRVAGIE